MYVYITSFSLLLGICSQKNEEHCYLGSLLVPVLLNCELLRPTVDGRHVKYIPYRHGSTSGRKVKLQPFRKFWFLYQHLAIEMFYV